VGQYTPRVCELQRRIYCYRIRIRSYVMCSVLTLEAANKHKTRFGMQRGPTLAYREIVHHEIDSPPTSTPILTRLLMVDAGRSTG